ncbi:MAG: TlpA disulfide reductase family protein, partial [Planctomycetota bacterium]
MIKFTNYGKTPTKVLEATVDDPTVTVTVTERKAGEAYTIQVQMPPGYAPPPQGRTITLKTDDAQKPVITVPIQAPPAAPTVTKRKQSKPAETLVGQPAPVFSLQTLEGKPLNNETLANSVAVLNFFAPNCGFCKKQIPRLEPIREKYADKSVRFVNVSEKMGTKEFAQNEIVEIIKGLGFKGELALDPTNAVGPLFKANSFPTMIVVGKTGKVEAVNSGNIADLETRLTGQIDALLAGKPVPAVAAAAQPPAPSDPAKDAAKDKPAEAPKRARPDDLVGKAAPAFTLTTVDGKPLSNAELAKGPATVLNFFAPNCGFCKKQIPRLETVRKTYAEKGVRFVNVVETMGKEFTQEETQTILKGLGAELEVARDPGNKVGPLFNATGYPTMVVVGKSGKVEAVNVGNVADLETRLQGQLDALIAGKPVPAPPAVAAAPKVAPKPNDPVGKPAPSFTLTTIDGKPLSNAELAGAPATVLNFFAPNCGYCKKQIPRVETIRKEYVPKGVRFVNVVETMGKEFTPEETQAILK